MARDGHRAGVYTVLGFTNVGEGKGGLISSKKLGFCAYHYMLTLCFILASPLCHGLVNLPYEVGILCLFTSVTVGIE